MSKGRGRLIQLGNFLNPVKGVRAMHNLPISVDLILISCARLRDANHPATIKTLSALCKGQRKEGRDLIGERGKMKMVARVISRERSIECMAHTIRWI